MKKLIRLLLQGLLYIAPIAITVYILYVIFSFVDGLLQDWLEQFLGISIPGLGLLITIALLIIIGFLGQTFIARPFKGNLNVSGVEFSVTIEVTRCPCRIQRHTVSILTLHEQVVQIAGVEHAVEIGVANISVLEFFNPDSDVFGINQIVGV